MFVQIIFREEVKQESGVCFILRSKSHMDSQQLYSSCKFNQYYIIVRQGRMRKSSISLRNLKVSKSTSQIRNSIPKVFSKITELYRNVSSLAAPENKDCYDLQLIVQQEHQLSKLFSLISKHISDKSYLHYLSKLEKTGLMLTNIRTFVCNPHDKLRTIDVQFTTSTHQTSCDRSNGINLNLCETRPKDKKMLSTQSNQPGDSIQKLKQTIAAKESILMKSYEKEKAKSMQKLKELGEKEYQIQRAVRDKAKLQAEYKQKVEALQQQLIEMARQVSKQQDTIRNLEHDNSQHKQVQFQLMKQRQENKDLVQKVARLSKLNDFNEINRLKAELDSVKNTNSKLQNQNIEKQMQLERLSETIQSLNEEISTLHSERPAQLMSEISKKNTIIQELAYDRENYSDGYTHLRQQQQQSKAIIDSLQNTISDLQKQLDYASNQTQRLHQHISDVEDEKKELEEALQQAKQSEREIRAELKGLRGELKGSKGQLRAAQQKNELLQQRYFRLRQNYDSDELTRTLTQKQMCKASKSVTERSQKVATANTYEKSTQRQGRKLKVIGDLRDLVKNHRLNLR